MSMLAGPRRKQKFSLNPRGKHWSEDPNKFGQKMLEKMGWSSGKGLGANEQGMTEHVRVRVKNDQVGIGYQKDKDDHWTEYQDDFNSFLQNLQKQQAGSVAETKDSDKVLSGKSLEEKSKQSQKRVHYKKFTRGKDVNKYSTKDLANIFGKKDLSEAIIKEEIIEEKKEVTYNSIGSKDTNAGILTFKGGNMDDYLKKKSFTGVQNGASHIKEEPDDDYESGVGFGYSLKSMSTLYVNDNGDEHEDCESQSESQKYLKFSFTKNNETKTKIKKHVDLNYVYDNPCLDLNILDDTAAPKSIVSKVTDLECSENITLKKRKSEFSYDNGELDLNDPDRHTPKKYKSDYSYDNMGIDRGFSENHVTIKREYNKDIYEIKEESLGSTKKRKSQKSKKVKNQQLSNGIENPALDLNALDRLQVKSESLPVSDYSINIEGSAETNNKPRIIKYEIIPNGSDLNYINMLTPKKTVEVNVESYINPALDFDVSKGPTPKKNRKIKNVDSLDAFDNPALDENFPTPEKIKEENNDFSNGFCNSGLDLNFSDHPKPKKSKKMIEEQLVFDGLENLGLELEDRSTPVEPKRSKNSQMLSNGLENPALQVDCDDKPTPKKSKKRKNYSMASSAFENLGLEVNSFTNEVCSSMGYEVSRTTIGVENNALDLSDENSSKKRVTFNDQLEYNTDVTKKKKKKKKHVLDKYEVVTDKLRKKHKHAESEATSFANESLDPHIRNEEEIENEINERKSRKSKRRRERRMSLLETIEEAPEDENFNEPPNTENELTNEKNDVVISENMHVDAVDDINENVPTKKSKKKKTSKKDATEVVEEIEVYNEPIDKKKKKKSVAEPVEIEKVDSPEKENKYNKKDKIEKADDKKIKDKSSNDGVISLEEFLNEEVPKTKKKNKNQRLDHEKCIERENTEVTVPKEYNENSHQCFKKTKQVMKSLFMKNPTLMFNGSNINEIKGYGSQFYDNYL